MTAQDHTAPAVTVLDHWIPLQAMFSLPPRVFIDQRCTHGEYKGFMPKFAKIGLNN